MPDINHMTSGDAAFANQAAAQEIVQAEKIVALLDNLANASIQKNDTIVKLVTTNQQQAKIITNLKEAIAKLKNGIPPNAATGEMREPSPLEIHQAKMGHNGVLLDARFLGQGGTQQGNLFFSQRRT
jgi:hypothetical protein